jgi:polyphosphate kinase
MDLKDHDLYINRELSWLDFNKRVLEEAQDRRNPLLERFKFLAITESNLDEFFMVRVAGLKEQVEAGYKKKDMAGLSPEKQLKAISEKVHHFCRMQHRCLTRSLLPHLDREGLRLLSYEETTPEQKEYLIHYFTETVYPVLTPMAIDPGRPFPLLTNMALNLGVRLTGGKETFYAMVQIPGVLPRILRLPGENTQDYILLESIVTEHIHTLFEGHIVDSVHPFRITRDADLSIDEEAEDLLIEIEKSIRQRKWGEPVRLEIQNGADPKLTEYLMSSLKLKEEDLYFIEGPPDLTAWMKFYGQTDMPSLKDVPMPPQPAQDFAGEDIFANIRHKDCMVHLPYESFDCVIRLLNAAADDPRVLAIKQTLYRVSGHSPVVDALIRAAENGKQVTVLVELKARFDEENNIEWARKLERAGCYVVYGLMGLKIHTKSLLIIRRETDGIRRYLHLGTGNYNDSTAKRYTDIGFFTCKETYSSDASALFNLLTGYSKPPQWKRIHVAPVGLRACFSQMIQNEINHASKGRGGRIIAKMNSLVDEDIIRELYTASRAGVEIDLIVRGICCLKPGVPGASETIRVRSIIGRFLEHSRIYCFGNGGNPLYYLSSADWMPRNLDRRVETLFPVEQEDLTARLKQILHIQLRDTVKARVMQPDGSYKRVDRRGKPYVNTQEFLHQIASQTARHQEEAAESGLFIPRTAPEEE